MKLSSVIQSLVQAIAEKGDLEITAMKLEQRNGEWHSDFQLARAELGSFDVNVTVYESRK
jgi:hypothetical protein